jgi:protein-histidine N-methyltransferase
MDKKIKVRNKLAICFIFRKTQELYPFLFQHLRQQYDMLFPMLFSDYPGIFKKEIYTWDKFLWACELFYSNSMKVVFSDGKLKTCLVPIAGLLNHSVST